MLPPTDAAVGTFLRRSMIVELGTVSPKRRPFMTPLWFVAYRGTLYITTGAQSWAGKNVQQQPNVTLLFSGERIGRPGQVLRLRGVASCHRGLPPWQVLLRIAAKYYVSPRGLTSELRNAQKWHLRGRYYAQVKGGAGYLSVVPIGCELLQAPG